VVRREHRLSQKERFRTAAYASAGSLGRLTRLPPCE
jgi:hypothetical protein